MAKNNVLEFEYIATAQGKHEPESGKVKANDKTQAAKALSDRGYGTIYKLEETGGSGLALEINIGKKAPKLKEIATWVRQLSIMINAGVSLIDSLSLIGKESENKMLKEASLEVEESIKSGNSFNEALIENEDNIFPPMMINMIKAAEVSGNLDEVLKEIADTLEGDARLKAKIKSAMTYPVAVLIMTGIIVVILLTFVVPIFQQMFDSLGGELPLPTQILVGLSQFLKFGAIPIVAAVIGFRVWWKKNRQEQWIRDSWEPLLLKVPVFGMLLKKVAIGRFTRNLSRLLASGVSLMEALAITRDTAGNIVVENALDDVLDHIRQGGGIAEEMRRHPIFPAMVVQMVATGEETGKIDEMLEKISDVYEDEVNTTTDSLTSLMEPILIAFLGTVVGGIIIALYMPIFSIIDVVSEGA